MKKIITSVFFMSFFFVSCNDSSDNTEIPKTEPEPTIVYDIPSVRIAVSGMIEKDVYKEAKIIIERKDETGIIIDTLLNVVTEIKGRGNSTWDMPKKPYRLKLKNKAEVLGMPSDKHWVLLANYADKTLMRNELAFEISRRMGFAYTPRMQFVDLYLNNIYDGNYMLGEHVRVGKDRVNINELKPNDSNISGDYFLEIDQRRGEPNWFESERARIVFCIKSPEDITASQMEYIKQHVQKVENILYSENSNMASELAKYVDLKIFIDYYLLNELANNVDGNLRLSTFIYKKKNDNKLYFGPVWDYDISFGNANYEDADKKTGWIVREKSEWYKRFFANAELNKMVKNRWNELRINKLKDLNTFIDEKAAILDKSQTKNFKRWDILNQYVWPNPQIAGSYGGEVAYLKNWLDIRVNWIDSQFK